MICFRRAINLSPCTPAGGPAPFGESGLQLLQVGLRVGGPAAVDPATGARRLMARGATLTVAFNPKVVQAYRLVGHATTTLTGPTRLGDASRPDGRERTVRPVRVVAEAGRRQRRGDGRLSAGTTPMAVPSGTWPRGSAGRNSPSRLPNAPASLQAVALAAETARVLRSHAAPGRGLGRVLDLAAQVPAATAVAAVVRRAGPVGHRGRQSPGQSGGRRSSGGHRWRALSRPGRLRTKASRRQFKTGSTSSCLAMLSHTPANPSGLVNLPIASVAIGRRDAPKATPAATLVIIRGIGGTGREAALPATRRAGHVRGVTAAG